MTFPKLFEPNYGPPAPEYIIQEPEANVYTAKDPQVCRDKIGLENTADFQSSYRGRVCYQPIMQVKMKKCTVPDDTYPVPVNVYFPVQEGPHGLMVFYHGGGWSTNSPDVYDLLTRYLACYGNMVVVSVDYRLAPEVKYADLREDCFKALAWAAANAEAFGADASKLCVCGDSAGGNLTAVMTLMDRDRETHYIMKQIMIFPCVTFRLDERPKSEEVYGNGGYFISVDSTKWNMSQYLFDDEQDALAPYASPLLAQNLKDLPPACFISAECDPLLDQGLMYAQRLKDAGNPVEYHVYEGMLHGFINRSYGKSFDALNDIIAFANRS